LDHVFVTNSKIKKKRHTAFAVDIWLPKKQLNDKIYNNGRKYERRLTDATWKGHDGNVVSKKNKYCHGHHYIFKLIKKLMIFIDNINE